MAELKQDFRYGKMNKDLDERLVPNGEYRDAMNIEVASSEGSEIGTVQNILGNQLAYNGLIGISGSECIGVIKDSAKDRIYWFIKGNTVDAIAEYDPLRRSVTPVIVDTQGILNFSRAYAYRITGVNIIENLLCFTDNLNEPKMINIDTFKAGSSNFSTHTQLRDHNNALYNFEERDITVIKKSPVQPPTLAMSNTLTDGPTETTLLQTNFTHTVDAEVVPLSTGNYTAGSGYLTFTTPAIDLLEWDGKKLKLTLLNDADDEEIILTVTDVNSTQNRIYVHIDAISTEILAGAQDWKVELIEDEKLFEFKFVRFAYRYKYKDGQYSAIGPFTEVAFLPQEFDYAPKKGYNLGMVNELKKLTISNFRTAHKPKDVVEIDILYKDDVNTNVYTVKSIKGYYGNKDDEWTSNSLEITSEVIHKVLPANQMIRPWDNVPKVAKAQEMVANRLVYGNYKHQYNVVDGNNREITPLFKVTAPAIVGPPGEPSKSIKSLRTYQVGIVYLDEYGRETPVLTDPSGSIQLDKAAARRYNKLSVRVLNQPPQWATHFKFFIKETSQPYYNLAMDRHYKAEDGNVWLAFPSSERNKIDEETFLILKKRHDSDIFVSDPAKYKVIAIENNAPDFLTIKKVSKGFVEHDADGRMFLTGGYPEANTARVRISKLLWGRVFGGITGSNDDANLTSASIHQLSDLMCRITRGKRQTKWYNIANIIYVADNGGAVTFTNGNASDAGQHNGKYWQVDIEDKFDEGDAGWLGSVAAGTHFDSGCKFEICQRQKKLLPEFQGRFFAKVYRDAVLEQNITNFDNEDDYRIVASNQFGQIDRTIQNYNSGNAWTGKPKSYKFWREHEKGNFIGGTDTWNEKAAGWFIYKTHKPYWFKDIGGEGDIGMYRNQGSENAGKNKAEGYGAQTGSDIIEIGYHSFGEKTNNSENGQNEAWVDFWQKFGKASANSELKPEHSDFVKGLQQLEGIIRFASDPDENRIYRIKGYRRSALAMYEGRSSGGSGRTATFASSRVVLWTIKLDRPLEWAPEDTYDASAPETSGIQNFGNGQSYRTEIQLGSTFIDEEENDGFTSDNPAIWETEPKEAPELNLFFEATEGYALDNALSNPHGAARQLPYSNCISFANGVESNRIRDDFNAPTISKGVKASSTLAEKYEEEHKTNGLIFSQIFNSSSGINRLNQFIMGENITKDENPAYGSIQKLNARDSDMTVLCEDKCLNILANKDALFNADGNANVTSNMAVLGQSVPYVGEFGISKDPTSFATYGFRSYFTDKARGVVLRLSRNGLEPISAHGMLDYFRDKLAETDIAIGAFNDKKGLYDISLQSSSVRGLDDTISFKEEVQGWPSRKSYLPEAGISLNNLYYTFKNGEMYSHDNEVRNTFYGGSAVNSSVKFIFSDAPDTVKSFGTLNYEGSQSKVIQDLTDGEYFNNATKAGWYASSVVTDLEEGNVYQFKNKENKWFSFIQGNTLTSPTLANINSDEFNIQGIGEMKEAASGDTTPSDVTITIIENND